MYFQYFIRIFDVTVGDLAQVNKAILVNADVNKSAKSCNVGNDARQLHAHFQIADGIYTFCKAESFKLLARVAARFGKFGHDIIQGWQTNGFGNIFLQRNAFAQGWVAHQVFHCAFHISGHLL